MHTLSSCDATLLKLETYISTCDSEKVTTGPTAGGIRLPLYYVDDDLSPSVPRSRCVIQVLWHPRSGRRPPVASFDIFKPQEIQQAAIRVRDQCVKGNQFHGPQVGKEWILTRQWVLVLLGTALVGEGLWQKRTTLQHPGKQSSLRSLPPAASNPSFHEITMYWKSTSEENLIYDARGVTLEHVLNEYRDPTNPGAILKPVVNTLTDFRFQAFTDESEKHTAQPFFMKANLAEE
ncbi:hypothetical protein ABVK25_011116 [Lepraria finkii]|uniref:Uncharacterized protein n=1 Tax=Lepraria finkii TaxID=1340010 RepID=A0ABR4AQP1_9LECA